MSGLCHHILATVGNTSVISITVSFEKPPPYTITTHKSYDSFWALVGMTLIESFGETIH